MCGVETPSQVRYVYQFWNHLKRTRSNSTSPAPPPACPRPVIVLQSLRFEHGFFTKPAKPLKVLVQSGRARVHELVYESPSLPAFS